LKLAVLRLRVGMFVYPQQQGRPSIRTIRAGSPLHREGDPSSGTTAAINSSENFTA
jgi:hypothetical protein